MILEVQCFARGRNYMGDFQKLIHVPKEIPQDAWKIYLNNNCITDIESRVFAKNSKCTNLRLDRNRLTEVRKEMWTGLVALEWLSLEHNDIEIVYPFAFADLPNIKGLYLDNNKLTILPGNIFSLKQILVLEILTLHRNDLKRDELNWLQKLCDGGQIQQYTIRGMTLFVPLTPTTTRLMVHTRVFSLHKVNFFVFATGKLESRILKVSVLQASWLSQVGMRV